MSIPAGREAKADGPRAGRRMAAAAVVWRSLPLQAAFNPQSLQGAGFAHAVLPWLKRVHGSLAGRRAASLAAGFNANPYLATYAIGAVAVAEGVEPESRIDRFLALVRGPLGSLGDSLFWGAARPAVFVPAALAVAGGAPWWVAVAVLAPYNALALGARVTGARAGLAWGLEVARALGDSWIRRAPAGVCRSGALAIGVAAGWLLVLGAGPRGRTPWLGAPPAGGVGEVAGWAAAAVAFAAATVAFVLWPRRLGWGLALGAAWAMIAAVDRWIG